MKFLTPLSLSAVAVVGAVFLAAAASAAPIAASVDTSASTPIGVTSFSTDVDTASLTSSDEGVGVAAPTISNAVEIEAETPVVETDAATPSASTVVVEEETATPTAPASNVEPVTPAAPVAGEEAVTPTAPTVAGEEAVTPAAPTVVVEEETATPTSPASNVEPVTPDRGVMSVSVENSGVGEVSSFILGEGDTVYCEWNGYVLGVFSDLCDAQIRAAIDLSEQSNRNIFWAKGVESWGGLGCPPIYGVNNPAPEPIPALVVNCEVVSIEPSDLEADRLADVYSQIFNDFS